MGSFPNLTTVTSSENDYFLMLSANVGVTSVRLTAKFAGDSDGKRKLTAGPTEESVGL